MKNSDVIFVVVFCGYPAFKLWKRELHILTLLWVSKNPEKAKEKSRKHDINTFQNDEEVSKQRIEMLEEEISNIEAGIKQLEEQQKQLLDYADGDYILLTSENSRGFVEGINQSIDIINSLKSGGKERGKE